MRRYKINKIIAGSSLDQKYAGKMLVAIPFGTEHTSMVTHSTGYMIIKKHAEPLEIRTFEDKFGRDKKYRLWYHLWKPTIPKTPPSADQGMAKGLSENPNAESILSEMRQQLSGKLPLRNAQRI